MTKIILAGLLVAASSFASAEETDASGKRWECKVRSEAGQIFTYRSTNRIWAKQNAIDRCEAANQGKCWFKSCHKKKKKDRHHGHKGHGAFN